VRFPTGCGSRSQACARRPCGSHLPGIAGDFQFATAVIGGFRTIIIEPERDYRLGAGKNAGEFATALEVAFHPRHRRVKTPRQPGEQSSGVIVGFAHRRDAKQIEPRIVGGGGQLASEIAIFRDMKLILACQFPCEYVGWRRSLRFKSETPPHRECGRRVSQRELLLSFHSSCRRRSHGSRFH